MSIVRVSSPYANTSSMFTWKWREILNARSREGTYLPFSMARIVCRVTPMATARSSCVISCIALNTLILFFIGLPFPVLSGIVHSEADIKEDHQAEQSQLEISHHPDRKDPRGASQETFAGKLRKIEEIHHCTDRECTENNPEYLESPHYRILGDLRAAFILDEICHGFPCSIHYQDADDKCNRFDP